jgi:small subunit ribosomal protein S4e
MIVMRRLVKIDSKIRTDLNYPAGFMDVVSIDKTNEHYRLLYDSKGRFVLHSLKKHPKELNVKLCKVKKNGHAKRATIGQNPFKEGRAKTVPYIITTDGRTIRYPDPAIKRNDTILWNFVTKKIVKFVKFELGNISYVVRGQNHGRIGTITKIEKHPGSFDVVTLTELPKKGREQRSFTTRGQNVFMIGKGSTSLISLPKNAGLRFTIEEDRDFQAAKHRNS